MQRRRFPEYLRLQNIHDRAVDIAELSPKARGIGVDEPLASGAGCAGTDQTVAKIGEFLPVEPRRSGSASAHGNAAPPAPINTQSIDGLGRMIDLMA